MFNFLRWPLLSLFMLSLSVVSQGLWAQDRGPLVPKMHAMALALRDLEKSPEENLKILKETAADCLKNSDALAVYGPGGVASKNLREFHDSFGILVEKIGKLEESMKEGRADRIQNVITEIWGLAQEAKSAFVPSRKEY